MMTRIASEYRYLRQFWKMVHSNVHAYFDHYYAALIEIRHTTRLTIMVTETAQRYILQCVIHASSVSRDVTIS